MPNLDNSLEDIVYSYTKVWGVASHTVIAYPFQDDGDTISFNTVITKESVREIDNLLASKSFYITPDGKLTYSAETDTLNYVLKHLSK